jgi:hypothetical protein
VLARGHAGKLVAAMIAPWLIATAAHALTAAIRGCAPTLPRIENAAARRGIS